MRPHPRIAVHPRIVLSIHAPARGATPITSEQRSIIALSIHAPARGATFLPCSSVYQTRPFNPRTRTGCDSLTKRSCTSSASFQSTHPHGVRRPLRPAGCRGCALSIHAPARGATAATRASGPDLDAFQSTHPHGVRRRFGEPAQETGELSIHAPARGATPGGSGSRRSRDLSIHAPARGATLPPISQPGQPGPFNPRTRTGCDSDIRP